MSGAECAAGHIPRKRRESRTSLSTATTMFIRCTHLLLLICVYTTLVAAAFDPFSYILTKGATFITNKALKAVKQKANLKGVINNESDQTFYFNGCSDPDQQSSFASIPGTIRPTEKTEFEVGGFMMPTKRDIQLKCSFGVLTKNKPPGETKDQETKDHNLLFFTQVKNHPCTPHNNVLGLAICKDEATCKVNKFKLAEVLKTAPTSDLTKDLTVGHFSKVRGTQNTPLVLCDSAAKVCIVAVMGSGHNVELYMDILNYADNVDVLKKTQEMNKATDWGDAQAMTTWMTS